MGVVKALREKMVLDGVRSYGCSAGAWACMALLLDKDVSIDAVHDDYCQCLKELPLVPLLAERTLRRMMKCMRESYAADTTRTFAEGSVLDKMVVSVSEIPWPSVLPVNCLRTAFSSWAEVEDAVVDSSMIPFIVGCRLSVLDGWITRNIVTYDANTVVVNFVGLWGDIVPSAYFNPAYIFLRPPPEESKRIFDLGYLDALGYLAKTRVVADHFKEDLVVVGTNSPRVYIQ